MQRKVIKPSMGLDKDVDTFRNETQQDKVIESSTSMHKVGVNKVVDEIQQNGLRCVLSKHTVKNAKGNKPKTSSSREKIAKIEKERAMKK